MIEHKNTGRNITPIITPTHIKHISSILNLSFLSIRYPPYNTIPIETTNSIKKITHLITSKIYTYVHLAFMLHLKYYFIYTGILQHQYKSSENRLVYFESHIN